MKKQSSSQKLYNSLADLYGDYVEKRKNYLRAIDQIIVDETKRCDTMLDAGSADGARAVKLARKLDVSRLFLIDNSINMVKECKKYEKRGIVVKLMNLAGGDLRSLKVKPELITCLYNVAGHIESTSGRVKALANMNAMIGEDGVVFIDVNNRYNLAAYGWFNVLKNVVKDLIKPGEINGDFKFEIKVKDKKIPATVHLFNPREIENVIKKSKLKILKKYYINYETGGIERSFWKGQMLFKLAKSI